MLAAETQQQRPASRSNLPSRGMSRGSLRASLANAPAPLSRAMSRGSSRGSMLSTSRPNSRAARPVPMTPERAAMLTAQKTSGRLMIEKAATMISSCARTLVCRIRFFNALRAATIISAAARGQIVRRDLRIKRRQATSIQARYRGRCSRLDEKAISQYQRAALRTVESLIKALEEGDQSTVRAILTTDLLVTVALPNFSWTGRGLLDFLGHPTLSKRQPKPSRVYRPLGFPNKKSGFDSVDVDDADNPSERTRLTLMREACIGITDVRRRHSSTHTHTHTHTHTRTHARALKPSSSCILSTLPPLCRASGPHSLQMRIEYSVRCETVDDKPAAGSPTRNGPSRSPTFSSQAATSRLRSHRQALMNGKPRVYRLSITHRVPPVGGDEDDDTSGGYHALNLRESFAKLDRDQSGHLSLGEVCNAMEL